MLDGILVFRLDSEQLFVVQGARILIPEPEIALKCPSRHALVAISQRFLNQFAFPLCRNPRMAQLLHSQGFLRPATGSGNLLEHLQHASLCYS